MRLRWFFVFFVVSGFCGLVYQVVWLRLVMAAFGVTTPMISVVVSVFMAGLAVGSLVAGRLADQPGWGPRVPLRLYAAAELTIATSAAIVPPGLELGRRLVASSPAGAEWASGAYYLASGGWVTLVLLAFCVCMGATYPLAMWAIREANPGLSRSSFGYLYVANVLGAALGTLTAAFVLVELLGFVGTLRVAATLNAAIGVAALALASRPGPSPAGSAAPAGSLAGASPVPQALPLLFATGFVSMGMEVVWTRQFAPYLGHVVYAFATVLAVYLLATLLGSRLYRSVLARGAAEPPPASIWVVVAALALLPLAATDARWVPLGQEPDRVLGLREVLQVLLGVGPFCAALGYVTPLLVDRWSGGDPRRAGRAYAVNAVGCILGPLAVGFGSLPVWGERWTLALTAALLPLVAAAVRPRAEPAPAAGRPWPALAGACLALALVAGTRDYETRFGRYLLRRDSTATVVATGEGGRQRLLVNGVGMTHLTPITKMMAHLPVSLLGHPPRRTLAICLGMGTTFRSLHSWPGEATAVELVPSVAGLLPHFHADALQLLRSPRARLVVDDGRRFLERSGTRYDAVVVDPPPPIEASGSSLLYSVEFNRAVRRRLEPGGILQAWMPNPGDDPWLAATILLAVREEFPHVRVFPSVEGWGMHVLASERPLLLPGRAELARRFPPEAARDLLEWGPHATVEDQLGAVFDNEILVDFPSLARLARPLVDDRPVNEYFLLRRLKASRQRPGA